MQPDNNGDIPALQGEKKKLYMSSNINLGKLLLLNRDHDNRLNHS